MFNLSKKINGKWFTLGRIEKNKWDNLQAGFKKTPELIAWFNEKAENEWLNLAVFEQKPKQPEDHNQDIAF